MERTRVAITGLGLVTPSGTGVEASWRGWLAGCSGIGAAQAFDPAAHGLAVRALGEVRDFAPEDHFERREARRLDRVMQFGRVAALEALEDAGLLEGEPRARTLGGDAPADRVGVYIGSGIGGITTLIHEQTVLAERGGNRVSPFLVPMMLADSIAGSVAIAHGLKGPNMAHLSACASGANAIGEAFECIRRGRADVMVAGGAESAMLPIIAAGFENMGALSTFGGEPSLASRPFDAERDGFVMGEGAGVLVLERLEHAEARGARIHAELVGYGATADAGHITAPDEDGAGFLRAVAVALGEAGARADDIGYVNAHGTGTPLNDAAETAALKTLLGRRAYDVPVSSIKSMIGHLLGAGGAVEAVATTLSVSTGTLPPTINLHHPDPACDLDYVPNVARDHQDVGLALSSSMGFGGHNAALLIARA